MKPRVSAAIPLLNLAPGATITVVSALASTQLFVRCNFGRAEALTPLKLDRDGRDQLLGALLGWFYLPELPDDETTVLIAAAEADVVEGYKEGDRWFQTHTGGTARVEIFGVYAWAHVPIPPPRKQPAPGLREMPVQGGVL